MRGKNILVIAVIAFGLAQLGCGTHRGLEPKSKGRGESIRGGDKGELDLSPLEFDFDVDVAAGEELFHCRYAQMPTDRVTAIKAAESHYTRGSHHLLAYRTSLREIPEGFEDSFACSEARTNRASRGSYYEAQQPDERRDMPPGIAHEFQPGEVLLIESHYINLTESDLAAHVSFKLHQVDPAEVEVEAGTLYFNNVRVRVEPHSKSKVTMTCPLSVDVHPGLLWSHMHRRGVHFTATTDDAEAADVLGTLYESNDWAEPKAREYPTDVVLHAGSNITFSCEYENDSDTMYVFGSSAEENEMCILHGMYWPRMSSFGENCVLGGLSATNEVL